MSICINTALLSSVIHWHGGWQHLVRQQQRGDRVHQDGEYQEQEVEHSLQQDTQLPRSEGREVTAHQTDQEHHKVGVEVEVARPAAEDMDAGEVACTQYIS